MKSATKLRGGGDGGAVAALPVKQMDTATAAE